MCQILGMNARTPTDFQFSFKGFTQRGGATDVHADGWGCCVYKGRGIQAFHEMAPSCTSPLASLLQTLPIKTHNIIAHIRYATVGNTTLENVHPFTRELWGRNWAFAHNGDLPHFASQTNGRPILGRCSAPPPPPLTIARFSPKTLHNTTCAQRHFNPVGTTDSEAVFVEILNAIEQKFCIENGMPSSCELFEFLKSLTDEIIEGGKGHAKGLGEKEADYQPIFNFLLCCGEGLQFAFCYPGKRPNSTTWNSLHYIVRRHPFKKASLKDVDYDINFKDVTDPNDQVCIITTKPLTVDECWIEMKKDELLMFEYGQPFGKKCCKLKEEEEERTGLDGGGSWDIGDIEEVDRTCGRIEFDSPKRKEKLREISRGSIEPLQLNDVGGG